MRFASLLTLIALLPPLYLLRLKIGPVPTTALELAIYALVLLWLIINRFRPPLPKKRLPDWLVGAWIIIGLIAALIDPNKIAGLGLWKAFFVDAVLAYYLVLSIAQKVGEFSLDALARGAILSAAIVAWLSVGTAAGGVGAEGRLAGIYQSSPNYLALYLAPMAVLGVGYFFSAPRNLLMIIWAAAVLLIISALEQTGSRGGMMAFFGGLTALVFMALGKFKHFKAARLARFLLVFAGALLVVGILWSARPNIYSHDRSASSSNIRYEIYKTSFEMLKKQPIIGVGLSNYQSYFTSLTKTRVNYPEFIAPQALTAHNLYLHTWLVTGIYGLVVLIAIIIYTLNNFRKLPYNKYRIFWAAVLVSILIYGLIDTPYFKNDLSVLFWLAIAALWFEPNANAANDSKSQPPACRLLP